MHKRNVKQDKRYPLTDTLLMYWQSKQTIYVQVGKECAKHLHQRKDKYDNLW